jgi:hypothetical protein
MLGLFCKCPAELIAKADFSVRLQLGYLNTTVTAETKRKEPGASELNMAAGRRVG